MDDVEALSQHVEYLFLKRIIIGLQNKSINLPTAKQYSIDFLKLVPFASAEDVYTKITQFVSQHPGLPELEEYMTVFEKEKDIPDKINKMREHLKQNDIEGALEVVKT